jgi:uncharacterized protein YndB with AHSA1/START domain
MNKHENILEHKLDSKLDLVLERIVDLPPEIIWQAWTKPEHLKHWFCPRPWGVSSCQIDLRPGGAFNTIMLSPDGQEFPMNGCYLEIIENRKLVWTDALISGYRPSEKPFFTGILNLEPLGTGTKYKAIGLHKDEVSRNQHEEMGFSKGWSIALDQLIEYMSKTK